MSQEFEYLAPTNLAGSLDEVTATVPLTWTPPVANNYQLFTTPGNATYSLPQGYTAFQVTQLGPGGGGQGGHVQTNGTTVCEGSAGGSGGGYAQATIPLASFGGLTQIPLHVGAGGVGGVGQTCVYPVTSAPFTAGGIGDATTFNTDWLVANPGPGGSISAPVAGGTATVRNDIGATSITTETGGTQGRGSDGETSDTQRNGGNTTHSGGGGAGGQTSTIPTGSSGSALGLVQTGGTVSAGGAGGVGSAGQGGPAQHTNATAPAANPGATIPTPPPLVGGGGGGGGGIGFTSADTAGLTATGSAGGLGGGYGGGGGGGGEGNAPAGGNTLAATATSGAGGNGRGGAVSVFAMSPALPLTGYAIYRDGIEIGRAGLTPAFTDLNPLTCNHDYTVVALSGDTIISPLSNVDTVNWNIQLQGQAAGNAGSDVLLTWMTCECTDTTFSIHQVGVSDPIAILPQNSVDGFVVMHLTPNTTYEFYVVGDVSGTSNGVTVTTGCRGVEVFNCDCSLEPVFQTLAELRYRIMVRLGYPNQAANPPRGMTALVDAFLYDAQKLIWKQLSRAGLNVERFFRWVMVPGQRYYGIDQNADRCDLKLDPYKVTWAGFEDLNRAWYRLTEGVPPEYYTRANINFGWPTHYEIRSCIEIFPAPQAPYTLWIKGDFGLAPFVADDDTATIDDQAVFMLALGMAKLHYGQKDGQSIMTQANTYIMGLVAGLHGTRRYVPRTQVQNPATPPRFIPLGDAQA